MVNLFFLAIFLDKIDLRCTYSILLDFYLIHTVNSTQEHQVVPINKNNNNKNNNNKNKMSYNIYSCKTQFFFLSHTYVPSGNVSSFTEYLMSMGTLGCNLNVSKIKAFVKIRHFTKAFIQDFHLIYSHPYNLKSD